MQLITIIFILVWLYCKCTTMGLKRIDIEIEKRNAKFLGSKKFTKLN